MKRDLALWVSVLAGPLLWLMSFQANFALAPWACTFQDKLALYMVSLAAFILSACSALLAWRQWTALGREWAGEGSGPVPRGRIMAIGGVVLSSASCLIILAQAIPELMLKSCE
jgi:hypothetical protein